MRKAEKNHDQDLEKIEKVLAFQKCPYEMMEYLRELAEGVSEDGLALVIMKAYCLGYINGKRSERIRRRRI
jgi:hypothetical protein